MTAWRGGTGLGPSPTGFRPLATPAASPERVVPQAQLPDQVWADDVGGGTSVVAKLVSRLRREVDPDGAPSLIRTVRGFGCALRADGQRPVTAGRRAGRCAAGGCPSAAPPR